MWRSAAQADVGLPRDASTTVGQRHANFLALRRFDRLDGLRAVSIALVLAAHSGVPALVLLHGYTGVTVFFVISGFLITSLLLREETVTGSVDLGGFYLRRLFRIFPLYYLALALFTIGALLGLASTSAEFLPRLPYFLTYTNELAPAGAFGHSWSLAVEEKYYLVWPVLVFLMPYAVKHRGSIGAVLLVVSGILGLVGPWRYAGLYTPILAGCVLALAAHNRRGFVVIDRMSRPVPGLIAFALVVVAIAVSADIHVQVAVGVAVALAFPALLLGPRWLAGWLGHPWVMHVGARSYAIYLFHPLVGSAVELVAAPNRSPAFSAAYVLLTAVGSLALAEVLYRGLEHPAIALGRKLSDRRRSLRDPGRGRAADGATA